VVASVPHGVTEVEKQAMEEAVFRAGARRVSLIEEPLAAALGSGLRVTGPKGKMIVDIGGGTTEVAVISLGGIVTSNSLRIAGDELDAAIVEHIRTTRGILIGDMTAEELKVRIGTVHPDIDRGSLTVSGMSMQRRMGVTLEVQSRELYEALSPAIEQIVATVKQTLEQTPPELSSDLYDFGILLTGGGALLPGLARLITERTGVRTQIAKRPMESVCNGILRIISTTTDGDGLLRYRER